MTEVTLADCRVCGGHDFETQPRMFETLGVVTNGDFCTSCGEARLSQEMEAAVTELEGALELVAPQLCAVDKLQLSHLGQQIREQVEAGMWPNFEPLFKLILFGCLPPAEGARALSDARDAIQGLYMKPEGWHARCSFCGDALEDGGKECERHS